MLAVRNHQILALGSRETYPTGNELRPYWLDTPQVNPGKARLAVEYLMRTLAERVTAPVRAALPA